MKRLAALVMLLPFLSGCGLFSAIDHISADNRKADHSQYALRVYGRAQEVLDALDKRDFAITDYDDPERAFKAYSEYDKKVRELLQKLQEEAADEVTK